MKCIIASCNPFVTQDGTPLAPDDRLLQVALRAQGIACEVVPWEAADYPWKEADLVKIASTWNYHLTWQRYREWLLHVASGTRLLNPLQAVLWNMQKSTYFGDLRREGIPLVPTELLRRGEVVDLAGRLGEHGWDRAVLKPSVGANSFGCLCVCRSDADSLTAGQAHLDAILPQQDMLLQPFLRSIEEGGETSHVFVGGYWRHAFGKAPFAPREACDPIPRGERPVHPPTDEVELAVRVMLTVQAILDLPLLYGRVDIVRDGEGNPRVMEVEITEPMLHLEQSDALSEIVRGLLDEYCVQSH